MTPGAAANCNRTSSAASTRSRLPAAQQRPAVQRQAPVIPLRLYGAAASSPRNWWRVVFPAATGQPGFGCARSPGIPRRNAARTRPGRGSASRPSMPAVSGGTSTVAAAGQADIVPVISTAHAATIHDISLRTHYTRVLTVKMARKLLIAPVTRARGSARSKERYASKRIDLPAIPPAFWNAPTSAGRASAT